MSGTLDWRDRIALPAAAVIRVELLDISRQDAPADRLARTEIAPRRAPPLPFALAYDPARIDPRHRYALRATIRADDRLLYTSTQIYPVITLGASSRATIVLARVGGAPSSRGDADAPDLLGTWLAQDIGGRGVIDDLQSTVGFGAIGHVSGFAGCNGFVGSYRIDGASIRMRLRVVSTKRCPPAVADQERKFLSALREATRARLDKGLLYLAGADGAPLLTLAKR